MKAFAILLCSAVLMLTGCAKDHSAARQHVNMLDIGEIVSEYAGATNSTFVTCEGNTAHLVIVWRQDGGGLMIQFHQELHLSAHGQSLSDKVRL